VLARGAGAFDLEDGRLRIAAMPAFRAAAEGSLPGLIAVEDGLVAIVVVEVTEDERVLHPDQGLAKAPALR
jgi:hypothetical protein